MAEKAAGGTEPPKYTADAVSATEMALAKLSSGGTYSPPTQWAEMAGGDGSSSPPGQVSK